MPKSISCQQSTPIVKHSTLARFNFLIRSAGRHHQSLAGGQLGAFTKALPVWSSTLYSLLMEELNLTLVKRHISNNHALNYAQSNVKINFKK